MIKQTVLSEDDKQYQARSYEDLNEDSQSPFKKNNNFAKMRRKIIKQGGSFINFNSFHNVKAIEEVEKKKCHDPKADFFQKYKIGTKLGEGSQAVVKLCTEIGNQKQQLIVKIMDINDIELLFMRIQEHLIMQELNHPNIVKVLDFYVFKQEKKVYQIQERAKGKNLKQILAKESKLSEIESFNILRQLMRGISYLHSRNVCHRDLTLDNIIYSRETNKLTIIDFGISRKIVQDKMWTKTGKILYMAPEIFSNDYDLGVDVWSAGVVLFAITLGYLPFTRDGMGEMQVIQNIRTEEINFDELEISENLKDLLRKMLTKDPLKRIKPNDFFEHPWFLEMQKLSIYNKISPRKTFQEKNHEVFKNTGFHRFSG